MRNDVAWCCRIVLVTVLAVSLGQQVTAEDLPVNLAPVAKVSASSQFSDVYRPQMAISGTSR